MTTSSHYGHRARARFARFVSMPPSVMLAIRSLRNATAQALLNFLAEKCFGFGQGYVDLTYAKLARAIGRSTRMVAHASKLLREAGLVIVDKLLDGSYRWRVPVMLEEVKEDPHGALAVRPLGGGACNGLHGGYEEDCMGGMKSVACGLAPAEESLKVDGLRSETGFLSSEDSVPKRHDQEIPFKRQHHDEEPSSAAANVVDEAVGHKKLLEDLLALGTGQRVARGLLRNYEHVLISQALERVRQRNDIQNRAGYIVRELEDGGYEESLRAGEVLSGKTRSKTPVSEKVSDAPMVSVGVEQSRAEQERLERERQTREAAYRQSMESLLSRFAELSQDLKRELKARWTSHLEQMVPNTPKKAEILSDSKFQKIAFREVTKKFFELLDGGLGSKDALEKLAAG